MYDLYSWILVLWNQKVFKEVIKCTRLPFVRFVLCLDQYSSWDFFRIWGELIESDKVFRWLHLNYYFIATVFLYKESS